MTEPFRILFVCSGNACRSVMAEGFARAALNTGVGFNAGAGPNGGAGADFLVGSAGIQAVPGQPAHPYAVAAVAELGGEPTHTVARQLTRELLLDSDLVLTASTRHRDRAVALLPAASRRTFTLREFARLSRHLPPVTTGAVVDAVTHARSVVAAAAALRGQVPYVPPGEHDIADPKRRRGPVRACAQLMARVVGDCVAALVPTPASRPAAVQPAAVQSAAIRSAVSRFR